MCALGEFGAILSNEQDKKMIYEGKKTRDCLIRTNCLEINLSFFFFL